MAEILRMPRMSDTMEEGNLVGWLKKEGDAIEPGDILAEVETDKATMELESYQEGYLLHIGIKSGIVPVDGVLAIIGEKDEDITELLASIKNGEANADAPAAAESKAEEAPQETAPVAASAPAATSTATDDRIKASPLAKKMAEEAGISLASIQGTGDQGRIVKKDVEKAKSAPASQPAASRPAPILTSSAEDQRLPVSQMRKTIARRLGESKFGAPHFYLTTDINMDAVVKARKALNELAPQKISYNDIIVKAVATALQFHPNINSSWMNDHIRVNGNINIGVAVAVEDGLLVPVIQNTNLKSLSQINAEVRTLAGKAKEKKLQPNEMTGNTFTISNLGMFDITEFTAIINPPDSCILAVGSIIQTPVVKDEEIVVGNVMKVTMSCDHRVVDGAMGAAFLKTLKDLLESPLSMLI